MEEEAPEDFFKNNFEHVVKVNRETQKFDNHEEEVEEDDQGYEIDRDTMKLLSPDVQKTVEVVKQAEPAQRANRF